MIFAGILAGGSGRRMKFSDRPKQFIDLDGKPVIIHTIEKFLMMDSIEKIYVGMNPEWLSFFDDLLKKHLENSKDRIVTVSGGENRNTTIENILDQLNKDYDLSDRDFIITHDAVRPFVSLKILEDNIKGMKNYKAVDTVIPAIDTIVESIDGETITNIPPRHIIYSGQTPQTFVINEYRSIYDSMTQEERDRLTDACKVFLLNDIKVGLVDGDETNIKLTTINDLKLANAILEVC